MRKPCPETVSAWVRLVRAEHALRGAIEKDLKAAGFPPLSWYDALLELARAPDGALRPVALEHAMLLPQYSTSRLVVRLVEAGYVERRICPVDGRGHMVAITPAGRVLQKRMWEVYGAAIHRHVGAKLSAPEAAKLAELLGRLQDHVEP